MEKERRRKNESPQRFPHKLPVSSVSLRQLQQLPRLIRLSCLSCLYRLFIPVQPVTETLTAPVTCIRQQPAVSLLLVFFAVILPFSLAQAMLSMLLVVRGWLAISSWVPLGVCPQLL